MAVKKLKPNQVAGILKQMVAKQKGKCAVCGHPFSQRDYPVLDHCHKTGYIRGALHNSCNGAEGKVKVKAQRGHAGITPEAYVIGLGKYLEHHSTPRWQFIHPSHMNKDEKRLAKNKKAREKRARDKKTNEHS